MDADEYPYTAFDVASRGWRVIWRYVPFLGVENVSCSRMLSTLKPTFVLTHLLIRRYLKVMCASGGGLLEPFHQLYASSMLLHVL